MGTFKSVVSRRARGLVLLTLLLFLGTAIPVLADPPAEGAPPVVEEPGPAEGPSEAQVAEQMAQIEKEEAELAEELATSEAVREREESRDAFAGLGALESQELLRALFSDQLEALDADPARTLTDAKVLQTYDGGLAATIELEGETQLVDGSFPLRVEEDDGELRKLDLTLEATPDGFEPANPMTEVSIPAEADEAIAVGDDGLAVTPVGSASSGAERFGEKDVFYPEVALDTDRIVSPTTTGVEIFDFLRSVESPETLRYGIQLPDGAELRSDDGESAEIAREGDLLARVLPPIATDAQGTDVPVQLEVEGSSIVLRVAHRAGGYAYPILLDPTVQEDWYSTNWYNGYGITALNAWQYADNHSNFHGSTSCIHKCWGGSNRGLFVSNAPDNYGANVYGHYIYSAPNLYSYVDNVSILPFWRDTDGCNANTYPRPEDYVGFWDEVNKSWVTRLYNFARYQGYANVGFPDQWPAWGHSFMVGLTTSGGTAAPCWRDLYVGGALMYLSDWENPYLDSVSGVPTGWVSDAKPFTITVNAGDKGLGVQNVFIHGKSTGMVQSPAGKCAGTRSDPCPTYRSQPVTMTGDSFDEGEKEATASALDPLQQGSSSVSFMMHVDRTPPEVTLNGQLAEATDEDEGDLQDPEKWDKLPLPVYNLKIEAKDGSNANPASKRSGVKSIEVFLDDKGTPEQSWTQSCPGSSCPMTQTYTLKLNNLSAGRHTLKVKVYDQVDKLRERKIEFEFFPATGLDEDYVMQHFPLPDGIGNEAEEENPSRPELAVNVMNGNLFYRERDVDVEGAAADLEVERDYNSVLAKSEGTEWGIGWSLSQTPELETEEPEGGGGLLGNLFGGGGGLGGGLLLGGIELPTQVGEHRFDAGLQAVLTKEAGGGYEIDDESGDTGTALAFDAGGKVDELRTDGPATIDYDYEGGDLAEIAVDDPAGTDLPPEEIEEPEGSEAIGERPVYSSSFKYNLIGQSFSHPGDVAIDGQGNLWVVDQDNNRVLKFNAAGEYLGKLNPILYSLKRPTALAIDGGGNIWVVDAGNNRVQKFNSGGTYQSKFGSVGTGNGQFKEPEGIAIDAKGNIWVSDTDNGRVQKFNSSGTFVKVVSSKGSGSGQLGEPMGIDIGIGGNVFVADWQNNRVSVFNEAGEFVRQFGSEGSGEGQFKRPHGIDVDYDGRVWVGDQNNGRVQRFDEDGRYVSQFGSGGSGEGQFSFSSPMGIASDAGGHIWVTDTGNNRVQKWSVPKPEDTIIHVGQFGSSGTGDGQLSSPSALVIDTQGNFWVADRSNNRIEKFNAKGEYLSQFGSPGTGNGQFSKPTSLAIDGGGNIWVVDAGNNRVQKFNSGGTYQSKFGSVGTGNGQFKEPEGIAIDAKGNIWVSDTDNGRVQKFNSGGTFIKVVSSKGSGSGQLGEPTGIDVGPGGNVWVADSQNNRVSVFNEAGEYIGQLGSAGTGNGQFNRPVAIDVDSEGRVWIGDQNNSRVQWFGQIGHYVAQFGSEGSGEGQFSFSSPMGIATDSKGTIWVTDPDNDRIQRWHVVPQLAPAENPGVQDDPRLEVEVDDGLVESVEGEEAGGHSYSHEGDLLTSHDGPQGETSYEYDGAGRLTYVALPNGTTGSVTYNATYSRVSSVTVDPAGAEPAETTHFTFQDDPRRTTVEPANAPVITYDIGGDGSVLRWWNSEVPPDFDDMGGTLYDQRETPQPIAVLDYNLTTQAHSEEGIASIEVIANGNQLVDERTCEQDFETPGIECVTLVNEWVTYTGNWPPGILNLEVIITDRLGHQASERFWVNIPYTPPPAPGVPPAPRFEDIAHFREEFGLDLDLKGDELLINDRIFDLIGAWYNPQTPEGVVARATQGRWGVPLRAVDAAELEYREQYLAQNGPVISTWGESEFPSTYAGYYMDHRAGGKLRVGFTSNQTAQVESLKQQSGLAAIDRLSPFSNTPVRSLSSLRATWQDFHQRIGSRPDIAVLLTTGRLDVKDNKVSLGATNTATMDGFLASAYGSTSAFNTFFDPLQGTARKTCAEEGADPRELNNRLYAGDWIREGLNDCGCTLAFGAWEERAPKPNGAPVLVHYALTAGHCYAIEGRIRRGTPDKDGKETLISAFGTVERRSKFISQAGFETDAEAIRMDQGTEVPRWINSAGSQSMINGSAEWRPGQTLCFSGSYGGARCGPTSPEPIEESYSEAYSYPNWQIEVRAYSECGDSGSPVWDPVTGSAVGLLTGGPGCFSGPTWVTPLLPLEGKPYAKEVAPGAAPGALGAPSMNFPAPLHIVDPIG